MRRRAHQLGNGCRPSRPTRFRTRGFGHEDRTSRQLLLYRFRELCRCVSPCVPALHQAATAPSLPSRTSRRWNKASRYLPNAAPFPPSDRLRKPPIRPTTNNLNRKPCSLAQARAAPARRGRGKGGETAALGQGQSQERLSTSRASAGEPAQTSTRQTVDRSRLQPSSFGPPLSLPPASTCSISLSCLFVSLSMMRSSVLSSVLLAGLAQAHMTICQFAVLPFSGRAAQPARGRRSSALAPGLTAN